MKKAIFYTMILFIMFFYGITYSEAKNEEMVCDYELMFESQTAVSYASYMNINVIVYDDGTHIVQSYIGGELKTIEDGLTIGGLDYFVSGTNRGTTGINIDFNDNFSKIMDKTKSCPDIYSYQSDPGYPQMTIEFSEDGSSSVNGWSGYPHVFFDKAEQVNRNPEKEEPKKPVITKSCIRSASSKDLGVSGVEITFEMYSDGTKKYCIRERSGNLSCAKADEILMYSKAGMPELTQFYIPSGEIEKVFNQPHFSNFDKNDFVCPNELYLVKATEILSSGSQVWEIRTTPETNLPTVGTSNGSLEDNGEADDSPITDIYIPSSDSNFSFGDFDGCDAILNDEQGSMFAEWLSRLLKLVQIGAIVLVIVLTAVDSIRAFASFEEKNSKSFYKRLLTRLICIAILFLVPGLIEMMLSLGGANNAIAKALQNPWCGLF